MSLAPSPPAEVLELRLEREGFRPSSASALEPGEAELCSRLHCQRCNQRGLECRAYVRLGASGEESRALAVCPRCDAAEVLPRSGAEMLLRRADERAGLSALGAVALMAALLALADAAVSQALKIVLALLIILPVAFLAYLARNSPGGGDAGPVGG